MSNIYKNASEALMKTKEIKILEHELPEKLIL